MLERAQSLDWRTDAEIMKAIISFYTKARAWEQLSGFYDACAQVEIDEFRNYDKAIGAMTEALRVAGNIKIGKFAGATSANIATSHGSSAEAARSERVANLEGRIETMQKFAEARQASKEDPETMLALCGELLDQPDADQAIRKGDVFSLLIEHYFRAGEAEK
jgi:intraflagellar transport protein 140